MGTRYKLTWRAHEGRWRKRYKGKDHYFSLKAGENKATSYQRCLREWERLKREIDETQDESQDQRKWAATIAQVKVRLQQYRLEQDRLRWMFWYQMLLAFERFHATDSPFYLPGSPETDDLDDMLNQDIGTPLLQQGEQQLPPPWEVYCVDEPEQAPNTVEQASQRFLEVKRQEVELGKISQNRYKLLGIAIRSFLGVVGDIRLENLNGVQLERFKAHLESRIHEGNLSPYTGRDFLIVSKQLVNWLYLREYINTKPRLLNDRSFSIQVGDNHITTFTADELRDILHGAEGPLRLYLLLMANCGMTQKDVSDLAPQEVDWREGRVIRSRSKTGAIKINHLLWSETFGLLKEYASNDSERVLLSKAGKPLCSPKDRIRLLFKSQVKANKPLKTIRATAGTLLDNHEIYGRYARHFLGHKVNNVTGKHYVEPSQSQFDAAVRWLGEQLGF